MSLFKVLKGDSSRISTEITPFKDGCFYFCTDDGKVYIDAEVDGEQRRVCINPDGVSPRQGIENAGKLLGVDANGDVVPVPMFSSETAIRWGDLNGANQGGD